MRLFTLAVIGLMSGLITLPLAAQDKDLQEKKPAAKKSAAKKKQAPVGAHKKPTPEQIRKFKELEKKKQQS